MAVLAATGRLRRRTRRSDEAATFYDGGNAQECIENCREGFLSARLPSADNANSNNRDIDRSSSSLAPLCSLLSGAGVHEDLWQLYWCDSAFCGVWIDPGLLGQDPNVDLLINQCQSIGFDSVRDPGPPPPNYSCSSLLSADQPAKPCRLATASAPLMTPSASVHTTATAVMTASSSAVVSTPANTPLASSSSRTHTATLAPATDVPSSSSSSSSASSDNGPSPGVKVAIVVCVFLGFLLAAGLVFLCMRKRRSRHAGGMGAEGRGDGEAREGRARFFRRPGQLAFLSRRHNQNSTSNFNHNYSSNNANGRHRRYADSDVPTPLISPASSCRSDSGPAPGRDGSSMSAATATRHTTGLFFSRSTASVPATASTTMTAPPSTATRGRPLLPAAWRWTSRHRSLSPPLTSLSPPPSPTADPAHHHSAVVLPYYFPSSPICAPTTNKLEPRRERVLTATTQQHRHRMVAAAGAPAPPKSPMRPPRPHEAPLAIPDLVMPDRPQQRPSWPASLGLRPPPPPPPPPPPQPPLRLLPAAAGPPPLRALPSPPGLPSSARSTPALVFSYPGRSASATRGGGGGSDRHRPSPPPPCSSSSGANTKTPTASVSSTVSSSNSSNGSSTTAASAASAISAASAADTMSTAVTSMMGAGPSSPGSEAAVPRTRETASPTRTIRAAKETKEGDEEDDGSITPTPITTAKNPTSKETDSEEEESLFGRRRRDVADEDDIF